MHVGRFAPSPSASATQRLSGLRVDVAAASLSRGTRPRGENAPLANAAPRPRELAQLLCFGQQYPPFLPRVLTVILRTLDETASVPRHAEVKTPTLGKKSRA